MESLAGRLRAIHDTRQAKERATASPKYTMGEVLGKSITVALCKRVRALGSAMSRMAADMVYSLPDLVAALLEAHEQAVQMDMTLLHPNLLNDNAHHGTTAAEVNFAYLAAGELKMTLRLWDWDKVAGYPCIQEAEYWTASETLVPSSFYQYHGQLKGQPLFEAKKKFVEDACNPMFVRDLHTRASLFGSHPNVAAGAVPVLDLASPESPSATPPPRTAPTSPGLSLSSSQASRMPSPPGPGGEPSSASPSQPPPSRPPPDLDLAAPGDPDAVAVERATGAETMTYMRELAETSVPDKMYSRVLSERSDVVYDSCDALRVVFAPDLCTTAKGALSPFPLPTLCVALGRAGGFGSQAVRRGVGLREAAAGAVRGRGQDVGERTGGAESRGAPGGRAAEHADDVLGGARLGGRTARRVHLGEGRGQVRGDGGEARGG